MALNKLGKDFCGPNELVRDVLKKDEKIRAAKELSWIIDNYSCHLIFTPNKQGGRINEQEVACHNLSKVFGSFISDGHSLIFAFRDRAAFTYFVEDLLNQDSKTYSELLIKHSVRIVPTTGTAYTLSGGSFAGVGLTLNDKAWQITKMIQRGFGDVDADVRLLAEGKFIAGLPPQAVNKFPKVKYEDIIEAPNQVGYRMEYCPYPTVAELVLSEHISPEQTIEALSNIYRVMFAEVYCIGLGPEERDDSYFERIDRRMERIVATPEHIGAKIKRLLKAQKIRIDGKEYEGFFSLYEKVRNSSVHSNLALPKDHCIAHGDMILEDILLNPYDGEFKLIDPNGRSHSRYYDLAKTLLSLATKYELFYFNEFRLEHDAKDEMDIHIVFNDPGMVDKYNQMEELFWEFLKKEERSFFREDPFWQERLRLLNALQNLAIVMFHLIHHDKEERASAFLLMGIKQLSNYLNS